MPQQDNQPHVTVRRAGRPGDLGWVVMAHGEVYDEQFGWNTDFEALVARIVADYAAGHDPAREAGWIAEVDGDRAGCVFLVAGDEPGVARLRILLVTPAARGLGVGSRLVGECLAFACEAGYRQVTLWTNDVLVSARRIYQGHGFTLVDEEPHHSFGHDLVGQNWTLDLHAGPAGDAAGPLGDGARGSTLEVCAGHAGDRSRRNAGR
ncbi:GNAT family N-acetyltransferase [Streptomyces spiralis]